MSAVSPQSVQTPGEERADGSMTWSCLGATGHVRGTHLTAPVTTSLVHSLK